MKSIVKCSACKRTLVDSEGNPYYLQCSSHDYHKFCYECIDDHDKVCTGFVRKVTIKDSPTFDNTKTEDKTIKKD